MFNYQWMTPISAAVLVAIALIVSTSAAEDFALPDDDSLLLSDGDLQMNGAQVIDDGDMTDSIRGYRQRRSTADGELHRERRNTNAIRNGELSRMNVHRRRHCVPQAQLTAKLNNYAQAYAQRLANNNCAFRHSGGPYGENLYMTSGSMNPGAAADAWYAEVNRYNYNNGGFSMATGHFTQLVWRTSTNFGLGVARCSNGRTIVVGSYEGPGNYAGQFQQNVLRPTC